MTSGALTAEPWLSYKTDKGGGIYLYESERLIDQM